MKVAVLGYSGAGKSTMARALGNLYGCAVLHLDTVQFLPGWVERDRQEARRMVCAFMDEHDAWVIDGNYGGFDQQRRLCEADRILIFDFPRLTCLRQAVGRYFVWRGKTRADMAEGCLEKMDLEFLWWIVWQGRTRDKRRHLQDIADQYAGKTTVVHSRAQADAVLDRWRAGH